MLATFASTVHAQCGAAPSLSIDPFARSLGMGGASAAVFWGGDPNDWANPALLGYRRGIRYQYSKYQLVPDLASDVFFRTTRISMGGWGVGLSFAGQPNLLGGARLDYGVSAATDVDGNVVGIFDSYETVESFGIGVSVMELATSLLDLTGRHTTLGRWGDVSIGWSRKRVLVDLAPTGPFGQPLEPVPAETNDLGFVLRARPFDTISNDGPGPRLEALGGFSLDAAFAMSWLNHEDSAVGTGFGAPDPIARDARLGLSVYAASGLPPAWRQRFDANRLSWLADGLTPFIAGGVTWERSDRTVPGVGDDRTDCSHADLYGVELILARVLSIRWGYVDAPNSGIDEATWGLGLGFSLGGFLGVRYDHASSPQAAGLVDRRSESVTCYIDGIALVERVRR